MYAVYKQAHPPTGLEFCLYCHFFGTAERNLVVAGTSQLYVYRLNHDAESGTKGDRNVGRGPRAQGEAGARGLLLLLRQRHVHGQRAAGRSQEGRPAAQLQGRQALGGGVRPRHTRPEDALAALLRGAGAAGRLRAERAHPQGARGPRRALRRDAHLRHAPGGAALPPRLAGRRARRPGGRGAEVELPAQLHHRRAGAGREAAQHHRHAVPVRVLRAHPPHPLRAQPDVAGARGGAPGHVQHRGHLAEHHAEGAPRHLVPQQSALRLHAGVGRPQTHRWGGDLRGELPAVPQPECAALRRLPQQPHRRNHRLPAAAAGRCACDAGLRSGRLHLLRQNGHLPEGRRD
uniref:Cleavage/polyadenylation specificity factor A subunit C-terminal domain-containing protein n=1 Tax=Gallus gallus TaxID=9031 RepID=A0A8V0Y4A9_CHICK